MAKRTLGAVAAGVVVVGAVAGGYLWNQNQLDAQLDRQAKTAATHFASAWSARKPEIAAFSGRTAAQVAASFTRSTGALGSVPVSVKVVSFERTSDVAASATLSVTWQLAGATAGAAPSAGARAEPWTYTEPILLRRPSGGAWGVVADGPTSLWQPQLPTAGSLVSNRTWGKRGAIRDRTGAALLTVGTVHDVQLDPVRATSSAAASLEKIVGEPAGSLVKKLAAAKKSGNRAPISVITYRSADFDAVKAQLAPLVGVIYPSRQQPLATNRLFGQPLLGSYGAVTADTVKAGRGRFVAGDYAGLSGLQGQYDAQLGGTPGVTISPSGTSSKTLFTRAATDGTDVKLTLDTSTQKAAESALARTGSVPSALVAISVKSGHLLAVANSPAFGFDRALLGRYQPGSTLKVATTYSLLSKGLDPSAPVNCPPTVTVNGYSIRNFEGETFGSVPFTTDFKNSCNTAFVGLSRTMADDDEHKAALALGIGAGWAAHLGVSEAFDGSVPVATSEVERAAAAFGQGKTLASPAALAVMTASVARGSYVEPTLVASPAVTGADPTPKPLSSTTVTQLRSLMRLVVTSGTGRAAFAGLGGSPVYGKTGTAEFGNATPPQTRGWFVGWRGDVAFAVLVEKGTSGGAVAAPVARDFLQRLG